MTDRSSRIAPTSSRSPRNISRNYCARKADALLPTVGGQTALNLAVELSESGVLEKYKVEMIGASLRAIKVAKIVCV